MKNKELLSLYEVLLGLNLKGVKFAYCVARNLAKMKPEVESLFKAQEGTQEFKEYDQKRVDLAKKHAKKDDSGEPLVEKNAYVLENKDLFTKEFNDLQKENKEIIEARESQIKEFNDLVERNSVVELYTIPLSDVPDEITSQQLTAIYSLIKDNE